MKTLVILSVLLVAVTVGVGFTQVSAVKADSETMTQDVAQFSSVTVPFDNLLVTNFEHDEPVPYECTRPDCMVVHITKINLLKFDFDNGIDKQSVTYSITDKSQSGGGIVAMGITYAPLGWRYIVESEGNFGGLLSFSGAGKDFTISPNVNSNYLDLFDEVTISTYGATMTVSADYFVVKEFKATFQDSEGNILAVVETVNKHIPEELIPDAPLIEKRPFLRWTNLEGQLVGGIITSDVTFLPFYSFDPEYTPETSAEPTPLDSVLTIIAKHSGALIGSLIGLIALIVLVPLLKGVFK